MVITHSLLDSQGAEEYPAWSKQMEG